ncbi:Sbal_3080 family lipoprotein [Maridesulfovibrio sp.]|uniref:Sbal_3080 family lipoprotein n=1 Tax=Maridesulfovibrio sp. TaxID=2795000 RepID=UPI0029F505A7|nr:Sbal_3080 family lipoprotein [Maridesulfovibrio sp.]
MSIYKFILIFVFLGFAGGCTSFEVVNEPVPDILQAEKVCLVEHDDTREYFKTALKEWLREQGIKPDVYPQGASTDICEWTLEYKGRWSWLVGLYLADANIIAYHDGYEAGRVRLDVGKWDGHKWEDGRQRIFKLMDMLSGKVDHYDLSQKNKSEDFF